MTRKGAGVFPNQCHFSKKGSFSSDSQVRGLNALYSTGSLSEADRKLPPQLLPERRQAAPALDLTMLRSWREALHPQAPCPRDGGQANTLLESAVRAGQRAAHGKMTRGQRAIHLSCPSR